MSRSRASRASFSVSGRAPMFRAARAASSMAYTSPEISSGGSSPWAMPSSPAARQAATARYGLQEGSGLRSSTRVLCPRTEGMRIRVDRLAEDQALYRGASYPAPRRL